MPRGRAHRYLPRGFGRIRRGRTGPRARRGHGPRGAAHVPSCTASSRELKKSAIGSASCRPPLSQHARTVDAVGTVRAAGGIAAASELLSRGINQDRIDRAVRSRLIVRIRRGWFALPDADPLQVCAVAAGGSLSCVSLLQKLGVWLMPYEDCHVRVDPRHHAGARAGVRVHWLAGSEAPRAGLDTAATALNVAIHCLSFEGAVVAVDSALNKRLVTLPHLRRCFEDRPRHLRVLDWADGSSESGIETLIRVRLRARGVRCRAQVPIAGVGRVDLIVGDRLIIEADGREHHESTLAFSADRRRDLSAQARGYSAVRLSYQQVMFEWAATERLLLALVRRDEHLWRARHLDAASSG